jgi:hypothetical protein
MFVLLSKIISLVPLIATGALLHYNSRKQVINIMLCNLHVILGQGVCVAQAVSGELFHDITSYVQPRVVEK